MSAEPIVSVFHQSPDQGRGLARDMCVRWALEEVGQSYSVQPVALRSALYRRRNPFGQIPSFQVGDLILFESSAIVLEIATTHPGLLPADHNARSRAIAWMFAAVTTVEPPIREREQCAFTESGRPWHPDRQPLMEERIHRRLADFSAYLGDADWIDGTFSAADLLMVTVLRRLETSTLLDLHPNLPRYIGRAVDRPAFQRAFAAQLETFRTSSVDFLPPEGCEWRCPRTELKRGS